MEDGKTCMVSWASAIILFSSLVEKNWDSLDYFTNIYFLPLDIVFAAVANFFFSWWLYAHIDRWSVKMAKNR